MPEVTQEYLKQRLDYSPFLGLFWFLPKPGHDPATRRWNTRWAEKQAGYLHKEGYILIRIGGRRYKAHRLAFLYMTGRWPKDQIDHINGDRADNRWHNLREATNTENARNRQRLNRNNTSGVTGVYWDKQKGKWRAKIRVNDKLIHLGLFTDKADAIAARQQAEQQHYGEYAPTHHSHSSLVTG